MWWPPATKFFQCYFVTVVLLLILMQLSVFSNVFGDLYKRVVGCSTPQRWRTTTLNKNNYLLFVTNIFRTFHLSQVSNHPGIPEWCSQEGPPSPNLFSTTGWLSVSHYCLDTSLYCHRSMSSPGAVRTYLRSLRFLSFSMTYLIEKDSKCGCSTVWQASSSVFTSGKSAP